jgi:DNA-binding response OmpR family regulator
MKIFFLEKNIGLKQKVISCLNACRFKFRIKSVENEDEIFTEKDSLESYCLFILNLRNPVDSKVIDYIRQCGGFAPILLILEADIDPKLLKTLYYLSYNDIIIKDFSPEEIIFRIYKLCNIWNDGIFCFGNEIYFDCEKNVLMRHDEQIFFGKKESLLLKYLCLKYPNLASYEEIIDYVYDNEVIAQDRIRSLIKQIRKKIPFNFIQTIKGEGFQIKKCVVKDILD